MERSEGSYELDGDMVLTDVWELLGINGSEVEAESETLGGWTVESFGDFPKEGDSFRWGAWSFTVLNMDGRRVEKVLARRMSDPGND